MLVWLQHEKDCFDNPTTYLPYMEGKGFVANILQSPVQECVVGELMTNYTIKDISIIMVRASATRSRKFR